MLNCIVILLCLLSLHKAACTEFEPCMNASQPLALRVTGCDKSPCKFEQGKNVVMEVDIGVDHDVNKMEAKVLAFALGVETSYPLPKPNVCQGLTNGECPLDAGEEVTYVLEMPILPSFPKVHFSVKFYIESDVGKEVCFKINGNVV